MNTITVAELIQYLQTCHPDATIVVSDRRSGGDWIELEYEQIDQFKMDGMNVVAIG